MKALKTYYWEVIEQADEAFRQAVTEGRALTWVSMCEGLAMARIGQEWVIFGRISAA